MQWVGRLDFFQIENATSGDRSGAIFQSGCDLYFLARFGTAVDLKM